jgi:hypothetical protein
VRKVLVSALVLASALTITLWHGRAAHAEPEPELGPEIEQPLGAPSCANTFAHLAQEQCRPWRCIITKWHQLTGTTDIWVDEGHCGV